jgi:hypothetical protein
MRLYSLPYTGGYDVQSLTDDEDVSYMRDLVDLVDMVDLMEWRERKREIGK